MSYLPVVWAGLFAYLGTSAGTCRTMDAEGSRLCAKCLVSIARGVLPDTCTAAMRRSIGEVIRKKKEKKKAKGCGRLATVFLFSLVGCLGITSLRG
ncbi:hypothetical protein GGR52DRAFT_562725 [Hypoxylon sp. FL1284]|nr:hypothetical protein GGR52DRAFT_562725 [Hypoxylon sp. FL1284]